MEQLKNLARFVSKFRLKDAPESVLNAARSCALDTVSVALGARDNAQNAAVRKVFLEQCGAPVHASSVWGTEAKASPSLAAFLNGMCGHTLELDDVHTASKGHIGTVVVPAAWALAESLGVTLERFLEAVVCGYETMARIGMAFGVSSHRNKGWHSTGTAGTFGAAAACGKLLNFSPEQMTSLFGLAGTQSFGVWAFLTGGATNKVLHPGRAASLGVESALLALAGMKGSSHILDAADGGIIPMMSDEYDYSFVDRGLGTEWEILKMDKKPYPCCRSAHGAIDAALALREEYALTPEQIERVTVDTYLVGYKQIGCSAGSRAPKLPTEAKFSTPYVVACALLKGAVGLDDFEPEQIAAPKRQELLRRVTVRPNDEFTSQYPTHWGCRMTVTAKDGREVSRTVWDASGSVAVPLSDAQLAAKVRSVCAGYDAADVSRLSEALLRGPLEGNLPQLPR